MPLDPPIGDGSMAFGAHDSFKNCVIMAKITINFTFQIGKMKANEILLTFLVSSKTSKLLRDVRVLRQHEGSPNPWTLYLRHRSSEASWPNIYIYIY